MDLSELPASVDLWFAEPARMTEALRGAYLALCDPDERARHQRITHDETRAHHLLTRALVRTTLSRYERREPSAWRFTFNDYGCPFITPSQATRGLHFNVSHTTDLIVCAVTRGRALGVDVEFEPRKSATTKIAKRFFSAPEVQALERLPEAEQRERFFCYWTLKEAYIKARGLGLAIPLKDFWFDVESSDAIRFDNTPSLNDDPQGWWFARFRASPAHPLAVALSGAPAQTVIIRAFDVTPLEGFHERSLVEVARSR